MNLVRLIAVLSNTLETDRVSRLYEALYGKPDSSQAPPS